jgi:hypothetical protein
MLILSTLNTHLLAFQPLSKSHIVASVCSISHIELTLGGPMIAYSS